MSSDVGKFIQILEKRESWTVDQEPTLYRECLLIAEAILDRPEKVSQVPFDSWLVFMASLPYGASIIVLARLNQALGNATTLMVTPRKGKKHVSEARTIMIHRLNAIVRNDMQKMMYLGKEEFIATIAEELQDTY